MRLVGKDILDMSETRESLHGGQQARDFDNYNGKTSCNAYKHAHELSFLVTRCVKRRNHQSTLNHWWLGTGEMIHWE
jgi:hypothetical protein